jgi:hypothetical protein
LTILGDIVYSLTKGIQHEQETEMTIDGLDQHTGVLVWRPPQLTTKSIAKGHAIGTNSTPPVFSKKKKQRPKSSQSKVSNHSKHIDWQFFRAMKHN